MHPKRAPLALMLGVSLIALSSAQVFAQDTDPLDQILVTGAAPDQKTENSDFVARQPASTKSTTPLVETQSSISIVTRHQFDEQAASNLSEALSYTAGVVTENFGYDGRFESFYLRGFNLENERYLDGLRLLRSTQNPTSAPSFELYGLDRVEVLKGPESVLYGAGSPAGLVNMIQKRTDETGDFSEVGTTFDTNGASAIFGDANRVVNDRFTYRITGKLSNTMGDVRDIDNKRGYLGLATSYALGANTTIDVLASYHRDEPLTPTGVPDSLVGHVSDKSLRKFYFADKDLMDSDRRMTNLGFTVTHDFGNGWTLVNNSRYSRFKWSYNGLYLGAATGYDIGRGYNTQDEDTESWATDTRLSGEVTTGAVLHRLTLGLDAQKLNEHALTTFSTASSINYLNPVYGNVTVGDPWYTADKSVNSQQIGAYALDEMSIGNWRVTGALRHDWTKQTGRNLTNYGDTDYARKDEATTGRVGLGYVWNNGLASYLSYATSYEPQPGVDVNDDVLNPTKGKQIELGAKYEPSWFNGYFTAAAYRLEQTDRNTTVEIEDVGGTRSGIEQVGKARVNGLELEAAAQIATGWTLRGAFTLMDTTISGENDGNELANTPRQSASLWLGHTISGGTFDGLTLNAGVRHIGSRWAENANTNKLDSVTLLDLGASYEWNGLLARLTINNVTDETYISAIGLNSNYYGDGRVAQASLTYKW
ncbi:MAG TPA: TonB-dependent siderophore receptor [Paenirhodobacter sp.]